MRNLTYCAADNLSSWIKVREGVAGDGLNHGFSLIKRITRLL